MTNGVAGAYFDASSTLSVFFFELCEEDRGPQDEGMGGELSVSMYGTRSAARNWQHCFADMLLQLRVPSDSWKYVHVQTVRM